ncbi:uncharacterized protein LY79DRAFT_573487 [Colletotrichum navitas]|uniref:Uncharacterized protein n=1 Tax=Colletotrichum navitas TaxID=681940 RepID=A0AAD8UV08_9PEZI|nr:uncharacterized protein LY79DRAFT_573487 [Colletotrichum navitas]KAK1564173.1 hypothetical protein LY79DRAFT_573487 [Colletotrichum navitas]
MRLPLGSHQILKKSLWPLETPVVCSNFQVANFDHFHRTLNSMQPTTSPQSPCEADSPPTNDVLREPRHIHQMLEQILVAIIISIAFFELKYSTTFWSRQAFTTANFQNMKVIFWDVMIHEPGPEIKGVRNRFSSDFRLRDDNPPTVLCFGNPKEKEEKEEEETKIQPIHMPFMNSSRPKKWDVWQKV